MDEIKSWDDLCRVCHAQLIRQFNAKCVQCLWCKTFYDKNAHLRNTPAPTFSVVILRLEEYENGQKLIS